MPSPAVFPGPDDSATLSHVIMFARRLRARGEDAGPGESSLVGGRSDRSAVPISREPSGERRRARWRGRRRVGCGCGWACIPMSPCRCRRSMWGWMCIGRRGSWRRGSWRPGAVVGGNAGVGGRNALASRSGRPTRLIALAGEAVAAGTIPLVRWLGRAAAKSDGVGLGRRTLAQATMAGEVSRSLPLLPRGPPSST